MGLTSKRWKPRTSKGIWYWADYRAAEDVANGIGATRIIPYGKGWAIQREISGPYWGPLGWT